MADIFSDTSSSSWFGRIGKSFMGILFGLLFVAGSVILLGWNENRAVTTANSLKEGAGTVVSVASAEVLPANDRKLIHLSGQVETGETLRDPVLGVEAVALQLKRQVEMYQWKEKKTTEKHTKLGGGEETTTRYEYTKEWSDELISSSNFTHPQDHSNPTVMPVSKLTLTTSRATLGGYRVSSYWIDQMHGAEGLHLSDNVLANLSADWKGKCKKEGETLYIGRDSNVPEVGDARVTFQVLRPGLFSILAEQAGPSLEPYATRAGGEIARVESGEVSAALMFQHAETENTILTWVARIGGFILMWVGFSMMLGPLKVLADIIPFAGTIVGIGTAMIAAIISFVASVVIVAVAWLVVRPLLGGSLLVVALAALILGFRHARRRAAAAPAR